MPRPRKPRYVDGQALPDHLYPDAQRRAGYWRYLKPDGRYKVFQASTEEAIRVAQEANTLRDKSVALGRKLPDRASLVYWVEKYIDWRQEYDLELKRIDSWTNRCNHLRRFSEHFEHTAVNRLVVSQIRTWWEALTFHQQHAQRAEFNKFFNYPAGQGLTPQLEYNPFTTNDDRASPTNHGTHRPACHENLPIRPWSSVHNG